ncbi:LysR family transcriptional regulator [Zafaria cholistanensis]|uniref:LysR family transcriptional regulator n=1 Tax=Zafaria cholistanensis TaxID=1682741 RepID=A0A5A7NPK5_9MICC|nr:LysR family transcriptional regulator [Zafaria cholistanensis]GER22730.1 LysR family transcriptional regulator [Zafaria cholistanensis]
MSGYTLRQLECFAAVAEHGSIASAAQRLLLSQSAVSGAVDALEKAFATQLTIRRKAHGVALTPSGRYVLEQARSLLSQAEDLRLHASDAGGQLRGALAVGCYSSLAPTVLARLIDHYTALHPLVELDFFAGSQREVRQRLDAGSLDAAIAYDMSLPPELARRRLYDALPSIVLAADHPLAERPGLTLGQVADEPMILLDVDPSRENTMMMFAAEGLQPRIRFRTTDFEVTRSLVARGMGYSILVQQPAGALSYEGKPVVVVPILPSVRKVPVSAVWPQAAHLSRAAAALVELAGELFADPHPRPYPDGADGT